MKVSKGPKVHSNELVSVAIRPQVHVIGGRCDQFFAMTGLMGHYRKIDNSRRRQSEPGNTVADAARISRKVSPGSRNGAPTSS